MGSAAKYAALIVLYMWGNASIVAGGQSQAAR